MAYASYEKEISTKIIRINHFVRIRKGESVSSIMHNLNQIPQFVELNEFADAGDYLEMVFLEERGGDVLPRTNNGSR